MKSTIKLALFCVLTALAACGQFSIAVAPSQVSLKPGDSQQFTVSLSNAQNPSGSWSVLPSNCGPIDANGLYVVANVSADQPCTISFKDAQNGKSASAIANIISLFDGPAELPRTVPNSSMASTPAPGQPVQVSPGGLQTAINSANCGDTLLLTGSYSGAYTLPAKPCDDNHWIIIRTSAPDSALPAEGTHINPCYAGVLSLPGRPAFTCPTSLNSPMAKIVAPSHVSPITLAPGANHYRLGPGLEIARAVGTGIVNALIVPAGAADHIIEDRDWIHGTAQDDTTRGIFLSGITYAAVVDSYVNDFHCTTGIGFCQDAQAISGGTGTLPQGNWKISGNFLEASTENILFGGVLKNSVTPADITITNNHLFKPLIWMPGQAGFVGGKETATAKCPNWDATGSIGQCPFVVKNLLELKNAQRVRIEGNVLDNVWPGFSQSGESILLSGLNPAAIAGATVYSTISIANVTLRYNRAAHGTAGLFVVNMAGQGEGTSPAQPNLPVSNVSIHDNVFDDLNKIYQNGYDASAFNVFNISSCPTCAPLTGISIRHNSLFSATPHIAFILSAPAPQSLDLAVADNVFTVPSALAIVVNGTTCGPSGSTNLSRINACLVANYVFKGNVLIGGTNTWPAGNFFPANPAAVVFQNYANGNGGDYHLQLSSPFAGKATDGKDPGADVDKVNQATAGVQ